jgi:hypothetical protein
MQATWPMQSVVKEFDIFVTQESFTDDHISIKGERELLLTHSNYTFWKG